MKHKLFTLVIVLLCVSCLLTAGGMLCYGRMDPAAFSDVGETAEWYVFAAGLERDAGKMKIYQQAFFQTFPDHLPNNPVTRQKIALASLMASNLEPDPDTAVFIASVMEESIGALGVMSWVFGLHLMNNGQISSKYTKEEVVEKLLSLQLEAGGWAVMGNVPDVDVTAMTLATLAPCRSDSAVQTAVHRALLFLSEAQGEDGAYQSYGVVNAESCAQVVIALAALGIDGGTDPRFMKNGISVWTALTEFRLSEGVYAHTKDGSAGAMASAQGICAETARTALRSPFIIVPWELAPGGSAPSGSFSPAPSEQSPSVSPDENSSKNQISYKLPVCLGISALAAAVLILLFFKKRRAVRHWLPVLIIWALLLAAVLLTEIRSPGQYYKDIAEKEEQIGTVTFSVRCDAVREEGFILPETELSICEGDTALSLLKEAAALAGISLSVTRSGYVSEIDGLSEMDYGALSGWMYRVNGALLSVGADDYVLADGDRVEWVYSLTMGEDIPA